MNPAGSPLRGGIQRVSRHVSRYVLPGLLHVLALLLMVCQSLPEPGPPALALSLAGPTITEVGDDRARADAPEMTRVASDADDLREAFAADGPDVLPVTASMADIDPVRTDEPRTRDVHPPVRPPRRIA